jgi:hypothetical protein
MMTESALVPTSIFGDVWGQRHVPRARLRAKKQEWKSGIIERDRLQKRQKGGTKKKTVMSGGYMSIQRTIQTIAKFGNTMCDRVTYQSVEYYDQRRIIAKKSMHTRRTQKISYRFR